MPPTAAEAADEIPTAEDLDRRALDCMRKAVGKKLKLVTAESCTGGALAALLTDLESVSHVFERGYVVYSDEAKTQCLDVDPASLEREGAVSARVAREMAEGALAGSNAHVCVSITGYAGPTDDGGEEGHVFLCGRSGEGAGVAREHHFGPRGRDDVRRLAMASALEILEQLVEGHEPQDET
jgi:nicotinamide-nucleotide amidase